ncbi:MAG: radical SAM protein [Candidatus Gastranaerophilales bacterium]|nr:radical SAM protein [Candidatus Gastranaerophilales bacterium]
MTEDLYLYNSSAKNPDAIPVWLCYPATNPIGMSSLGYLSLFRILDTNENVDAEMVFTDTKKTRIFAKNVKLAGFSFSFEFDFLGVFSLLEKFNIPFSSKNRTENHPLIFGGGPVLTSNPEPFSEIFDFIIIGDGEEILEEIIEKYREIQGLPRHEQLKKLATIEGIYVSSFYKVKYNEDDTIHAFEAVENVSLKVKRRVAKVQKTLYSPIISENSFFKGNFLIELSRGCSRKCKFCLACYSNLPTRYPGFESIKNAIDIALQNNLSIGLLGALIADHPDFDKIIAYIDKKRKIQEFGVSIASIRADKINPNTIKTLVSCGLKSTTIAIEAGSERLRKFINKNLTNEQIFESIKIAHKNGLSGMKLYGMLGLPTETDDDITEMLNLMKNLKKEFKKFNLCLSVSSFVPKAHTPFQFEGRVDNKILKSRLDFLKKELHKSGIEFKPTSLKWDYIQAILSRGDRRLAPLLEEIYRQKGGIGIWKKALKEFDNIPDFEFYANRQISHDEILPWDFIDTGMAKDILIKERLR